MLAARIAPTWKMKNPFPPASDWRMVSTSETGMLGSSARTSFCICAIMLSGGTDERTCKVRYAEIILRERNKEIRFLVPADEYVFSIGGQTDDFDERSGGTLQTEALPDRVLVGPELLRHGLIYDGDERGFVVVIFAGTHARAAAELASCRNKVRPHGCKSPREAAGREWAVVLRRKPSCRLARLPWAH